MVRQVSEHLHDDRDDRQEPKMSSRRYERYMEEISEGIAETIQQLGCQPILFIGSGLAKRYVNAPSWDDLLSHLAASCSLIDKEIGYYKQSLKTSPKIGEEFAERYHEWAWSSGKNEFPDDMFGPSVDAQAYIKFKIANYLRSLTPVSLEDLMALGHESEIRALQAIKPHAVITTNYDQMIEIVFPDHQPIIGQQILKGQQLAVGEIFKIHGCVSDYSQIVFTQSDYEAFTRKKKFLSAKLLTFFNEHPLIFIGYSASDPNIRAILSDIDEALPEKGGVVPNVYILEWDSSIGPESSPAREKVIATDEDRSIRVKLIEADDFSWVFNAFAANPVLNDVNPRVLRALIARSYELVRHDIPKMTVHADFKMLTEGVANASSFAKLFGIANITSYSSASAHHRYSATQLGKKLGGTSWHVAQKLIDRIRAKTGLNIKSSDNVYHRAEMLNNSVFHKYSKEAYDLLVRARDGLQYDVKI